MKRFSLIAALILLGTAIPLATDAQQQPPREVERDKNGDWTILCLEGTDDCRMTQVGRDANGQEALAVSIQRLRGATAQNGQEIPAAMQVQAPLGVLIPYGVRLKIDDGDTAPLGVTRCIRIGCIAGAPMTNDAVDLMKAGSEARFAYVLTQETIIPISLRGFTKSYNSLEPLDRPTQ